MAHQDQINKFNKSVGQQLKLNLDFESDIISKVRRELSTARKNIALALANAEGFEMVHFRGLERAVNEAMLDFNFKFKDLIDNETITAFDLGQSMVDAPFQDIGMSIKVSALPQLNLDVLEAQILRNTQFITNLSEEAARRINSQILVGITGEQSPFQVMKEIGRSLKSPSVFGTIANRAEAITRTELSSALNTAAFKRTEQIARVVPGLKKGWLHSGKQPGRATHRRVQAQTNPAFGGVPIAINKMFNVGGERALRPHGGGLSAKNTVGCGCRTITVIDDRSEVEAEALSVFV